MNHWFNAKVIASIPIFIAVNLAVIAIWYFDISEQSMPLVLGIIAGGLVDLDNRLTGRIKNVLYTLLAFSVSTISVQLSINHNFQFMVLMTAMTFVFTMIGAIGQRYSTIAFGTLVVALYTTLTYLPETVWYMNPLMILCGTLLYSITTLCVHLFFPNRPVQESVAKSFIALANYLDAKATFFDPDDIEQIENKHIAMAMKNSELISAFNETRTALFYRIRGQHRHSRTTKMIRYYFSAQDIHERISSNHFDYQTLAEHLKNTDLIFRIQRLLELQAQACRDIALSLQQNKTYRYDLRLEKAINGLNQSFELYSNSHIEETENLINLQTLLDNLKSVDYQLRHIDQEVNELEQTDTAQIYTEQITGLNNILLALRSHFNFNSQLFRHAVRLSIVVFICCTIGEFLPLDRAYWVLLTAVFVCQPNYTATKLRLKQRIVGTILGVILASLLPYANPTLELQLGLIVLTSTLFFFFRTNNYSFSTFFITLQVIFSFDVMGFNVEQALYSRVIDTLIGATISWFAVSYLWPDWKYLQLDKVSRQAIKSDAKYLLYIISQLQFGKGDNLKYRIARRYAHEYASALSATISNMNHEPKKYQAYLQAGFELLKINYSLLSYISTLGAYRSKMKQMQQSTFFLAEFYPAAKKIIYILEHIEQLTPMVFEKLQNNIEVSLKQAQSHLEKNHKAAQLQGHIPMQQLSMINQILPPLYHAVHKCC